MLCRVQCGVRLHILGRKILCGVVFMNRIATNGAAKHHDSGINSHALVSHSLWQRSKFHHNASEEDDDITSPSVKVQHVRCQFAHSGSSMIAMSCSLSNNSNDAKIPGSR